MTNISVYLINLARSPKRRERMDRLLAAAKLDYTLIEAVDGNLLNKEEIERVVCAAPGYDPFPAEVGCFLSHREAWRQIAMGQSRYGLILEDDLIIASNFHELIDAMGSLELDADIVQLEGRPGRYWARKPVKKFDFGYSVYKLDWSTDGTGCYLLSKEGAARLLKKVKHHTRPIDNILFRSGSPLRSSFRIYAIVPAACFQHSFYEGDKEDANFLATTIGVRPRERRQRSAIRKLSEEIMRVKERFTRKIAGWRRISTPLHPVGSIAADHVRQNLTRL